MMKEMRVLNPCIIEAMRIYPPAPNGMRRIVPKDGATISGRWVPSGTRVYTSQLATL